MVTRSIRAPARFSRTLAAVAVCALAAEATPRLRAASDEPDNSLPATTAQRENRPGDASSSQPAPDDRDEAQGVIKTFDFNERPRGNYEDTPMYWTRQTGDGLPAYSAGRIDDQTGHAAPPSFLFTLRGGNIGYEYARDDLTLAPDSDYLVEAYVRAEGLRQARALLTCYLVDEAGQRLPGSERLGAPIGGAADNPGAWQHVAFVVPGGFPTGSRLRLQFWVLQRHVWAEPDEHDSDPIIRQDVTGRIWLDDIVVRRLPSARLALANPGGLVAPGQHATIEIDAYNATAAPARGVLTILDPQGGVQFQQELNLPPQSNAHHTQAISELRPGLYRACLRLTGQFAPGGAESVALDRRADFAVLPPLPERAAYAADWGVDLGLWTAADATGAAELIEQLGCGAVRTGLPLVGTGADADAAGRVTPLRELVRRLAAQQIQTTAVIVSSTEGTSGTERTTTRDALDTDHEWDVRVGPILALLGNNLTSWQLGDERTELAAPGGWSANGLSQVRATLRRFMAAPELIVPCAMLESCFADGGSSTDPAVSSADAVSYWLPAAIPARSFPWHLAPWRDALLTRPLNDGAGATAAGADARRARPWLTLEPDRTASLTPADRLADLARRAVLGKAANPQRLYVPAPFVLRSEGGFPSWQPTEEYIPVRTLCHYLSGQRAVVSMTLPHEGVGILFTDGRSYTLVAWTWLHDPNVAPVELFLGADASAIDLAGTPQPLAREGASARIPLTPTPLVVVDVDAALLLLQDSVSLEPAFFELHDRGVRPLLTVENRGLAALAGKIELSPPPSWEVSPAAFPFEVAPGSKLERALEFTFPPRQMAAELQLSVTIHLSQPDTADIRLSLPLRVGLRDVSVEASAWWDGETLLVEQTLCNGTTGPVSYTAFCQAPARAQVERAFLDVPPGQTRTQVYRFPAARDVAGGQLWLGVQQIGGRRTLNQLVAVPR